MKYSSEYWDLVHNINVALKLLREKRKELKKIREDLRDMVKRRAEMRNQRRESCARVAVG